MRQCKICGKGSMMSGVRKKLRGKYNPTDWKREYPNLQYAKVKGVRTLICTQCLRTMTKKAASRKKEAAPAAA